MKRMIENPISFYTVKADDIKNIVSQGSDMFKYTPSPEFLEVLKDFKSALIIDWFEVYEPISHIIGARVSVIYPIGRPFLGDTGDVLGYAYSGGQMMKPVNPVFFELDGTYFINWNLK